MPSHALVLLSGGQDSTTALGVALRDCSRISAICIDYAQRHSIEINQAETICQKHNVPLKILDIGLVLTNLVTSGLVDADVDLKKDHPYLPGRPASFVPNRNALFLTLAHAYAMELEAQMLYTGMCQTDFSGYPDCREGFVNAMQHALNVGSEQNIIIKTPIMHLNKAETFALAADVGVLETVLELSHTCYEGDRVHSHAWGYGCGECPACKLRGEGWVEYMQAASLA